MKKVYTYPTIETVPYRTQIAICSGGGDNVGGGGDPEELGRAPRHAAPF